ncbi:baseplate J/gp47 family protein [Candidatus Caldatribacterium sp.]|uniref:baseplate J/gp47 family protein n=1 Tax=Candidatus Caldatribacterium sp. TaxID=2282143 RepID=UPI0038486404|nr:baseplate J/gp47 family protein [Candidatus Caldatribacterium sp.]
MSRTLEEILVKMLSWFASLTEKVTDFTVGSVIRALFEAVALELEELYAYVRSEIKRAIVESAYSIFGFQKREALPARVDLVFTLDPSHQGFVIPQGFTVSTADGVQFTTVIDVTIDPGRRSVTIPAVCTIPGFIGNVPANTITRLVSSSPWVIAVNNPAPALGGVDEESESARQRRFARYIQALGRGTRNAILFGLSTIPELSYVRVSEIHPGAIGVYIATPSGEVSEELLKKVSSVLSEWIAAGVQAVVYPVAVLRFDVTVEVELAKGFDEEAYRKTIETTVLNYLNTREVGEDYTPSHLIGTVMSVNPQAIRSVTVTPSLSIRVGDNQMIRPGKVTIIVRTRQEGL